MFIPSAVQLVNTRLIGGWFQAGQVKEDVHPLELEGWDLYLRAEWNASRRCGVVSVAHEERVEKQDSQAHPYECQEFEVSYHISAPRGRGLSFKKVI